MRKKERKKEKWGFNCMYKVIKRVSDNKGNVSMAPFVAQVGCQGKFLSSLSFSKVALEIAIGLFL